MSNYIPTKESIINVEGDFTLCYSGVWFIQTKIGNFIWNENADEGNGIIRPFRKGLVGFLYMVGVDCGIDGGCHEIRRKCGDAFTFLNKEFTL